MRTTLNTYVYYAIKRDEDGQYFIARKGKPYSSEWNSFKFKRLAIAVSERHEIEVYVRVDIGKRNEESIIKERDYERVLSNALLLNAGKVQTKSICEW